MLCVGANNSIQEAGVQYIIDSVVQALINNAARKYSYVETAFFQRWWDEQTETVQEQVKTLVANGQLEFVCFNVSAAFLSCNR